MLVAREPALKETLVFMKDPGEPLGQDPRVANPGRHCVHRINVYADRQLAAHAVVDRSPFGFQLHQPLLLPIGAGGQLGLLKDLQMHKPCRYQREAQTHEQKYRECPPPLFHLSRLLSGTRKKSMHKSNCKMQIAKLPACAYLPAALRRSDGT